MSRSYFISYSIFFQEKGTASRLAKVSFFRRFLKLATSKEMSPLVSEKKKQSLVDVCKNQNIDVTEYSEAKKGIFKLTL